jgi:hypothetical protein
MKAAGARLGNPHNLIMPARLVEGAGSRGGRLFDRNAGIEVVPTLRRLRSKMLACGLKALGSSRLPPDAWQDAVSALST